MGGSRSSGTAGAGLGTLSPPSSHSPETRLSPDDPSLPRLPERTWVDEERRRTISDTQYGFRVGSSDVTFYSKAVGGDDRTSVTYLFRVNGSFDRSERLDGRESLQIGLRLSRIMNHDVARFPEGTRFTVSAHTGDGFGSRRESAYRTLGFGASGYLGGDMHAVKRGGRLRPLTVGEYYSLGGV